jgi:carbonic anhydrase/acetyltransferase-like protein (isoleucine patch superfamily)
MRQLLSTGSWPRYLPHGELKALLHNPAGAPAVRPNTPVLPFGATPATSATFIDPTARIINGYAVIVSAPSFVGPYSTLDAHGGAIKIGSNSVILDNASIVANPAHAHTAPAPVVLIGNAVTIGYGAQVLGPSTIGAFGTAARLTGIGAGAVIKQATIEPGAYVGALAQVGPGVTIPSGKLVLPGKIVDTPEAALDPTEVVTIAGNALATQIVNELNTLRTTNLTLAAGYVTLYQGQSATGTSPGVPPTVTTVFNGNLAAVEGASQQPGSQTATTPFLPPGPGPLFPSPHQGQVQGLLYGFRARVTGRTNFLTRASHVAHSLGRGNSIRADQGQPPIAVQTINIGSIAQTGFGVTISAPLSGTGEPFAIGQNFRADTGAVILGGPGKVIGDNVSIGAGAVVDGTSLGSGSTVGAGAYLLNSAFPAGTNIPAGAIFVNSVQIGSVGS